MSDFHRNRSASVHFKRGVEHMVKNNWDMACVDFREAVNLVPDNLLFRQSLRGTAERKFRDNRKGAENAELQLLSIKFSVEASRKRSDWNAVDQFCEDGLALNPWDASLNADLGNAMKFRGNVDIAIYCYGRAVKLDPGNTEYRRILKGLMSDNDPESDASSAVFA